MLHIDENNNITLTRGDSATIELAIKDDGMTYDYSNDLVQLTVKRNTVTEEIIFQKTFSSNVIIIEPEDTSKLNITINEEKYQINNNDYGIIAKIPSNQETYEISFIIENKGDKTEYIIRK